MPQEFEDILSGIKKSLSGKTNPRTKKTYTDDDFYAIATAAYKKKYGKNPHGKADDFLFTIENFEIKAENGKHYVCGYAATTNIDKVNDQITVNCLKDMATQLKGKEVKVVLGIEHDWVRSGDPRLLPYAKVTDADVVVNGNEARLWVKTELNEHHPLFENIWGSLTDGFLNAFSIEYQPMTKWNTSVDGKSVRVLDKIDVMGITYTGRPINPNATISDVFMKAYATIDADDVMDQMLHSEGVPTQAPLQEIKGFDEQLKKGIKVEMEHTTDPKVAEKIARDHLAEVPDYYDKLEKCVENKGCGKVETKEPETENKKEEEKMEEKPVEQKAEAPKPEVKADPIEGLKKENLELKAQVDELKKRVELKAMIKEAFKELSVEEKAFKPAEPTEVKALDDKLKEEKFPETKAEIYKPNYTVKGMIENTFGKPRV